MISGRNLFGIRVAIAVALLGIWQYLSQARHLEFYLSKPTDIAGRLDQWISDGTLISHLQATVFVAIVGFAIGACAGLSVGLLLGRAATTAKVIDPFLMAFYSMPKVALAPVFVLWFGVDTSMKVIFVSLVVFFLVFLNTYSGVRNVSREQLTILRLMGARESDLMRKVVLPSALVWVFTGLRLSVPYALIGTILGEMMATNKGLGFLLANTAGTFDTTGTFATLVVIVALSMVFNALVRLAESTLMPWQARLDEQEVSI
ncbi:ABC transporter permease [Roseiarcaceae bacterium H3SJ34-1]|uniref:ABC transporter permease n=1 Tax=Terripilifer ovatus TaxID=3032367 RepID=UPI003AB9B7E8|nr:ABC transporter permease [Roseiarcaceae bacterium H3SJ34-1]